MSVHMFSRSAWGILAPALLGFSLATCGSDGGGDETKLEALVYADWNGNGQLDSGSERGVFKVEMEVSGSTKVETDMEGIASFDVAPGSYQVRIGKIPPSFRVTTPTEVRADVADGQATEVRFGIRPDVPGSRLPFKYVLVGDSITSGYTQNTDLSYSVDGFDRPLGTRFTQHFGRSVIANRSFAGTKSSCGLSMLDSRLDATVGLLTCHCRRTDQAIGQQEDNTSRDIEPFGPGAYLLILYGTNDINDRGNCLDETCRRSSDFCNTISNLRGMVQQARAAGAIPVLGTVTPGLKEGCQPQWNVNFNEAVVSLNADIRAFAQSSGTLLADNWKAFKAAQSPPLNQLISDYRLWTTDQGQQRCGPGLHPTRAGYALMAEVAYLAITGQPSPYDNTPVPASRPLADALADYDRFVQETGFVAEPLPHVH